MPKSPESPRKVAKTSPSQTDVKKSPPQKSPSPSKENAKKSPSPSKENAKKSPPPSPLEQKTTAILAVLADGDTSILYSILSFLICPVAHSSEALAKKRTGVRLDYRSASAVSRGWNKTVWELISPSPLHAGK